MKKKGRPKQPLKEPTLEQITWLKANYKLYNRYHLTQILQIRDKDLSAWLKLLGLRKRDCHVVVVTDEQAAFIEKNYKKMRHEKIAIRLGISVMTVYGYCRKNGLKKNKLPPPREEQKPKEIITFEPKPKLQRPRADHTNLSREQHVNYWLNYPI